MSGFGTTSNKFLVRLHVMQLLVMFFVLSVGEYVVKCRVCFINFIISGAH